MLTGTLKIILQRLQSKKKRVTCY
uniref:Uncharacterized protein n=1 Tax=Arundo donax TaxID=35708 RepID=A0A0A8ZRA1_ARUDO